MTEGEKSGRGRLGQWLSRWLAPSVLVVIVGAVVTAVLTYWLTSRDSEGPSSRPSITTAPPSGADTEMPPDNLPSDRESSSALPASDNPFTAGYDNKRIKIVAPNDGAYVAVVDLDNAKVDAVLKTEWNDGAATRLGYDLAFEWRGNLRSSVPWKRSSRAAAPQSPSACFEAAKTSEDGDSLWGGHMGAGDVFCIETSDGQVAQAVFDSYADVQPPSIAFNVTLWRK